MKASRKSIALQRNLVAFYAKSLRFILAGLVVFQVPLVQIANAQSPNFVLIILDDMAWAGTSVQMDPTIPDSMSDYHRTPNLESFASESMIFSDAYACGPMCSPSRVGIMTGKSPAQLNVTDVRNSGEFDKSQYLSLYRGFPLMPPVPRTGWYGETTLADALKQVDPTYKAGLVGKADWAPSPRQDGYDFFETNQESGNVGTVDPQGMYSITNSGISFMQQQVAQAKPFFLTLGHYAMKEPFESTPETFAEFDGVPLGTKHHNQNYAAMHRDFDKTLGMVTDQISALGIEDNTYVIITSDHGAATGIAQAESVNAPLYGGKGTIWEGGLRVPLIVKGPGITAGTYSDVPVQLSDLLPTMVDLAGGTGPLPTGVEGTSFRSVLENDGHLPAGQAALSRPWGANGELFFHFPHYSPDIPIGRSKPASAIRDGDFKMVRLYGENGEPNSYMLFNLAENIEESNDLNSPLNLASQMPEKVLEMDRKLETWLNGVDASLPYDVRAPRELTWKGESSAELPNVWTSANDVDNYWHERWIPAVIAGTPDTPSVPIVHEVESFQPGLSNKALAFDGNDGLYHQFFQVSDSKDLSIDGDHSATFQAWIRLDDLDTEQLLFETGSTTQGLSLTLGDANGDSVKDELRFRVAGRTANNFLTLTTEIDKFADPTEEFISLTAVVSDKSTDRYLEIYVNGELAGRVNGVLGNTILDWDGFYQASLGRVSPLSSTLGYLKPDTLGGSAGTESLPFAGGNFRGDLAEFEFRNYALSANQIREQYNSYLDAVDVGIGALTGQTLVPEFRPSNVSLNMTQSTSLLVIEEKHAALKGDLQLNVVVNGPLSIGADDQAANATISAGTEFTSYLLHFDPTSNNSSIMESVSGTIEFGQKIIGIVFDQTLLSGSDALLGVIGNYGLESDRGLVFGESDFLSVSADQYTLNFNLSTLGNELLQFRVLTQAIAFAEADFNFDGFVNNEDLLIWQNAFRINSNGDTDNDGDTDGRDFLTWQRQLTGNTEQATYHTSVPEPGSLLLGSGLLAFGLAFRRRVA